VRKKVGERVEAGEPIASMHLGARPLETPEAVAARLRAAFRIGEGPASPGPLVIQRIDEVTT
jgi:hypothetical protein